MVCAFSLSFVFLSRSAMQVRGSFGQEPIIFSEGPWSAGLLCDVNYLECLSLNLTFLQPNGTAEYWLTFRAWFCCPS